MCGVIGVIYKNTEAAGLASVGSDLIKMLESLEHRGRDSTGITIGGVENKSDYIVRFRIEDQNSNALEMLSKGISSIGAVIEYSGFANGFGKICVNYEADVGKLANTIADIDGVEVDSIGTNSEIVKDVGDATELNDHHAIGEIKGTHGIGHVRMATESKIDVSHSHPFWAYPFPDISVVNNCQLTNYHSLRRKYQHMGHKYQTGND